METTGDTETIAQFNFVNVQDSTANYWETNGIYDKCKEKVKSGKKFYFLDGPPYTSGKVHVGTAWNKSLKDCLIRYKRMCGYNVWDRAGYDMHGLPTEKQTEKLMKITGGKQEIETKVGRDFFVQKCRELCSNNLLEMNKTFTSMGIWMDFGNAYQSISKDFINGEWWFIKKAHEKGRLYQGKRPMYWDTVNATAQAKHELEYEQMEDTAIFVRFRVLGEDSPNKSYFVVWTTTPWTIPFNLAVMVNPKAEYAKVLIKNFKKETQYWYLANDLVRPLLTEKLGLKETVDYEVEQTFLGNSLKGREYEHPFASKTEIYSQLKQKHSNVHTCVLSEEHVTTKEGTGIVHCAPGCGPEDYEVGHRNQLPAFNLVDETGMFKDMKPFDGLYAKTDDLSFIKSLDEVGALVYQHSYVHDYPIGQRSKKPIIFRTTNQWFLKIEDLKQKLLEENDKVNWLPVAAYNAFTQWLENIRDNSISKQRYWGTPLPVWVNQDDPNDIIVVGSSKELTELAGLQEEPKDLHIDHVDKIVIQKVGKDGKSHEYKRVPDVLDVWVDAGTTLWNCLGSSKENLDEWYPADFIVEGRDQIRGWFNLLHLMSVLLHGKLAFKNCYMHGYINDSTGRKMSKSVGNYILPEEVTQKYGVDVMRFYMIGATSPGLDMNYNFKDLDTKMKNFRVFWNLMKYSLDFKKNSGINARSISDLVEEKILDVEEFYILSKLHATIKKVTEKFEKYLLNEVPSLVENFLLELSHNYLQLVWEKASSGSDSEKCAILSTVVYSVTLSMVLLAPISPFFSDRVFLNLKNTFPELSELNVESVHLKDWPKNDEKLINEKLERDFLVAQDAITAVLNARDRSGLGVKWPVKEVKFHSNSVEDLQSLKNMSSLVQLRTNTKQILFGKVESTVEVHANKKTVRKTFGKTHTKYVSNYIEDNRSKYEALLLANKPVDEELKKGEESLGIITKEHLFFSEKVKDPYVMGTQANIFAYLDTSRSDELEWEGISREFVRRVQLQRKRLNLQRKDSVQLFVETSSKFLSDALTVHMDYVTDRSGCIKLELVEKLETKLEDDIQSESLKREVTYRVALRKVVSQT